MSPDLSAAERAYRRLKAAILEGKLGAGPLDIGLLGDRLRMSATPVREALARLRAEHLVNCSPHLGYAIKFPSARRLEHLYELSGALLDLSLKGMRRTRSPAQTARMLTAASDYATDVTEFLKEIAVSQANLELSARISETGDRLFNARRLEPDIFPDAAGKLDSMRRLWTQQEVGPLRKLLRVHHELRVARAFVLAQALSDSSDEPRA